MLVMFTEHGMTTDLASMRIHRVSFALPAPISRVLRQVNYV